MPESATEWIDSASIDDDWVRRNATNFVAAIPRLAANAAMIALLPPPALICQPIPSVRIGLDSSFISEIAGTAIGSSPCASAR